MSDDPAEDAVREKLHQTFGYMVTSELCRTTARAAVEAARPIIEAEVRAADDTILTSASCYEGDHDDCNVGGENHFRCRCECHDVYDVEPARAAVRTEPEQ